MFTMQPRTCVYVQQQIKPLAKEWCVLVYICTAYMALTLQHKTDLGGITSLSSAMNYLCSVDYS